VNLKRPTTLVRLALSVLPAAPSLLGAQAVTPTSRSGAQAVAERPRLADPCVMTLTGNSRDDPVAACHASLPGRLKSKAICTARQFAPDVVLAAEAVRATTGGSLVYYGTGKAVLHSAEGQLARRYEWFEPTVDQ
jgi:hypothetical protein